MMKKITYFLLVLVILMVGCVQQPGKGDQKLSESDPLVGTEWVGVIEGTAIEEVDLSRDSWTYTKKHVELGKFSFTIVEERGRLVAKGSGTGTTTFSLNGGCSGGGTLHTEFDVGGEVDELTGKIRLDIYFGYLDKKMHGDYTKECPSKHCSTRNAVYVCDEYLDTKEDTYTVLFNQFDIRLDPVSGASYEYITEGGRTYPAKNYKVTLTLAPHHLFDFDVDVDPPILTIKQGETAKATVNVKLVRGNPQPVKLTVTDWSSQNINAWFDQSSLAMGERTVLNIKAGCSTPPGEYLYTAQGEVGFRSSVDSVNVEVTNYPDCKSE